MQLVRRSSFTYLTPLIALTTAALAAACGDDGTTDPNVPRALTRVSPDSQSTLAGVVMTEPLVVRVTGASGAPLAGAEVAWTIVSGGGSLSAAFDTTDTAGEASTLYTPGTTAGPAEVQAIAGAVLTVNFKVTLTAGPLARLDKFGSSNPAAIKGSKLTLSVKAVDQFGNGIEGVAVAWTASGGTVESATGTTNAGGVTSTNFTLGEAPGAYTLTATSEGLAPVTFTITAI